MSDDVTIKDQGDIHDPWCGRSEQQENEVVLKKAEKEVIWRVSVILDTPLRRSYQSKTNAINIFASVLALTFLRFIFLTKILMRLIWELNVYKLSGKERDIPITLIQCF